MKNLLKGFCGKLLDYVREIDERERLVIIRFKGDIDASTIPCVQARLESKMPDFVKKNILADFKEVTRVDSATFASIILLLDQLQENGRTLGVMNISEMFVQYLTIEKLDKIVQVYGSEQEAVARLG